MRGWLLGVLPVLLLGGALRVACLRPEFWLDEIWSWQLAQQAGSPLGVFALKHDNNHHLNTAWLSLWPAGLDWAWYRLHAVVAGLAAIVLAARCGRRLGAAESVIAAFLMAGCYWMVLASTEARGYALAVCFALAAFDALWAYLDNRSRPALVVFWLSCILGFLSHLTFIHAYLGFLVWSQRRFARQRASSRDEVKQLLICHGAVAAFFVPFYLACVRGMEIGGAPPQPVSEVLGRLVSVGLGGPAESWAMLPWVAAAALSFVTGVWLLRVEGRDVWLFFAVACVGSPALFLLRPAGFLFERYFFVSFVFFLVLTAHVLGSVWRWRSARHGRGRVVLTAALLAAFLAGSLWHVLAYAQAGRGRFHEALAWVAEQDESGEVVVTGDNDFRVRKYVEFYADYLPQPGRVVYQGRDAGERRPAEWQLFHRLPREDQTADDAVPGYRLVRSYPSTGREAWGWFVYRRQP